MANGESPDLFIHRLVVRTTSPATGRWFMDSHKLPFPWHLQVEKIFFCANLIIEKLQLVSIFVKNQSYNWFVPFLKESTKISLNKFFWSVMYWQTVIMQTSKIQANQDPMKYYKWHFVKQLEWLLKTLQTTWKQRNSGFSSFILILANLDLRNSFLKSRVVWFDKYRIVASTNTCYYLENQVFGGVTIRVLCSKRGCH